MKLGMAISFSSSKLRSYSIEILSSLLKVVHLAILILFTVWHIFILVTQNKMKPVAFLPILFKL